MTKKSAATKPSTARIRMPSGSVPVHGSSIIGSLILAPPESSSLPSKLGDPSTNKSFLSNVAVCHLLLLCWDQHIGKIVTFNRWGKAAMKRSRVLVVGDIGRFNCTLHQIVSPERVQTGYQRECAQMEKIQARVAVGSCFWRTQRRRVFEFLCIFHID